MHPQFADSASYAGRFRQLQSRAMSTIRTKVNQILRHAADQVPPPPPLPLCLPTLLVKRIGSIPQLQKRPRRGEPQQEKAHKSKWCQIVGMTTDKYAYSVLNAVLYPEPPPSVLPSWTFFHLKCKHPFPNIAVDCQNNHRRVCT